MAASFLNSTKLLGSIYVRNLHSCDEYSFPNFCSSEVDFYYLWMLIKLSALPFGLDNVKKLIAISNPFNAENAKG